MTEPNHVASHYTVDDLTNRVLAALKETHGSLEGLSVADVAGADSFHIRGRAATVELAERVGFQSDWRVLDLGSGPGGTVRHLAATDGCHVTGLDITPSFVTLADELSRLVGLENATDYQCGDALDMPFDDADFDCVWLEHVQMNIPDKQALLAEIHRVLKPGGTLALHEILRGTGGDALYPAPWAERPEDSHLVTSDDLQHIARDTGFQITDWRDVSKIAVAWFQEMTRKSSGTGPPPLGVQLNINQNAPEKLANVRQNLEQHCITVIQAILRKSAQ